MNNYSDGEFANTKSSFFPKKSYNKIINMNLINSKAFMRYNINEIDKEEENKKNLMSDFIKRSMRFYSIFFIYQNINIKFYV
jgi:hypothetical protein